MKYRRLTANGDYTFGKGPANFVQDTPETVAQAVKTRLSLVQGEWMLDTNAGTPYNSDILGAGKISTYDRAIQSVILNTPGVRRIAAYSSGVDPVTRKATVNVTIDTIYGQAITRVNI